MNDSLLLAVAVFAPLVASVLALVVRPGGLLAGRVIAVGCGVATLAAIVALVISASRSDGLVGGTAGLGLGVGRATALLLVAVTATATVVASFARRNLDLDSRRLRFFALLGVLVTGSALVVVPGGWLALAVGWVGSTWALVGLVGHRSDLAASARAVRRTGQALVAGDVALLLAVAIMLSLAGSDATRSVAATADELGASTVAGISALDLVALLLVIAGASRSALLPFHRWLVATLAAPTPVSALVHAGFVSGAGLLLVRFGPIVLPSFAVQIAFALAVVSVVVAVGAASTRVDVKGRLAWSTVGQMGFMVIQCTVGAFSGAVFHIVGHGMYKASLFLGAGDAISAGLRSRRRATAVQLPSLRIRLLASMLVPSIVVGLGIVILPPDVSDGGVILVAVFAWATVAHGVWSWLGRGAMLPLPALGVSLGGGLVSVLCYLGGLRLVEAFVEPAFDRATTESGVSVPTLVATLIGIAAVAGVVMFVRSPAITRTRAWLELGFERTAHPGVSNLSGALSKTAGRGAADVERRRSAVDGVRASPSDDAITRSQIRADVARAGSIVAPNWPLTSFVAVNPLGGLEQRGFDDATAVARHHLGARTHLTLAEFRRDHAAGLTTIDDVQWAIESQFVEVCSTPSFSIGDRRWNAAEIIELDMLHGPDEVTVRAPLTALDRLDAQSSESRESRESRASSELIDATLSHSVAQFVTRSSSLHGGTGSFMARWRRDATRLSDLRWHLHPAAVQWLANLGDDPADVIDAAFALTGIDENTRVAEMRGHLARMHGWAGYAKWRTDWAHPDERRPSLTLIDLVSARCALEAALMLSGSTERIDPGEQQPVGSDASGSLADRVDAVVALLGASAEQAEARAAVAAVLERVGPSARNAAWLHAQERNVDHRLLTTLDRLDPGPTTGEIAAQLAFCIDVRSEGLRRHLEASGPYETIGFAGFFGVTMSVRRLEWDHFEPRCPVLVTPSVHSIECVSGGSSAQRDVDRMLDRDRLKAGLAAVHAGTKYGVGAPFVMAEAAGWVAGPIAAARTLLPPKVQRAQRPPTVMALDDDPDNGLALEQRVYTAEAVLKTMGLTQGFAPLVVLSGHTSENVNNPHATALDCGACAGASGEDNARSVARLLNDIEVRVGLRERGIDIPHRTHFAPALHETVSDRVEILDVHDVPAGHRDILDRLRSDLAAAGARQSAQRAELLPGRSDAVGRRGADWAQVRPEWGLARNSSFIIGPRSMTAGLDLGGRSFLHTYDADQDVDGKVLETIMTAPLVVGHWISSQYYFSTVDPETFGAGDKLIHNVVGDTGVISGENGGLRVGFPRQSTHCGDARHHQPVRLLAVIQAPLERVERIIDEHQILTTLVEGSWIRVAARSHPHERWSLRTPNGTWSAEPRPIDIRPDIDRLHDIEHTDIEHADIQHSDIEHTDIQPTETS